MKSFFMLKITKNEWLKYINISNSITNEIFSKRNRE